MSQSNVDEDVRNYLNDALGLNLDKEALIKPTRDVVMEIYTKYLDATQLNWRKFQESEGASAQACIVYLLRTFWSRFNTTYTFNRSDLLFPTRKRTAAFVEVIVYILAKAEEDFKLFQHLKNERLLELEAAERNKQMISHKRLQRDELAVKKANSKSIDQLRKEIDESRQTFNALKKIGEDKAEEARQVKAENKFESEQMAQTQGKLEALVRKDSELAKTLQFLNDGRGVKERITASERALKSQAESNITRSHELSKLKETLAKDKEHFNEHRLKQEDQDEIMDVVRLSKNKEAIKNELDLMKSRENSLQIKAAQLRHELSMVEGESKRKLAQFELRTQESILTGTTLTKQIEELESQIKDSEEKHKERRDIFEKELADSHAKIAVMKEDSDARAKEAEQWLEQMTKLNQDSIEDNREKIISIMKSNQHIQNLMGIESLKNRTYIKESK